MPGLAALAAFDLDGTLSRRDTTSQLVRRRAGIDGVARAVLAERAALLAMARDRHADAPRAAAKEALLGHLLRGVPEATFDRLAEEVAERVSSSGAHGAVVDRLRWHQREGHEVVVVSAASLLGVTFAT